MSDDGIGPYPTPQPSPYRLVPSWNEDLGYGEDFEPDQMIATLEGLRAKLRIDSGTGMELERIIAYVTHCWEKEDG